MRRFTTAPTTEEIVALADEALAWAAQRLPRHLAGILDGVHILVEEMPDEETLADLGLDNPWDLTGLWRGVPMTERSVTHPSPMPPAIFLYRFILLPDFTALENVVIPQLVKGASRAEANARAQSLLTGLGLAERLTHRPSKLSGGEQQRVAVARALANRPALVLADEPTGNLDEATADIVFDEFLRLVREEGSAALVATHNERIAARMDRVLRLHEGVLE